MDKMYIISLLFPILMGILLLQYRKELLLLAKNKLINEAATYDLGIVVLSARENIKQRNAIRATWWGNVLGNDSLANRVLLRFVVGTEGCPYAPEDRLNEFTCEEWKPVLVPSEEVLFAAHEDNSTVHTRHRRAYCVQYLPFQVDHPVLLGRLGLHKSTFVDGATVKLLDAISEKTIVEATFHQDSLGELEGGFYYKDVETYLLPKRFEGVVVSENPRHSTGHLPCPTTAFTVRLTNSSALHFLQFSGPIEGHYQDHRSWQADHAVTVSFTYRLQDVAALNTSISGRLERTGATRDTNKVLTAALQQEQSDNGDMLLVDMVDVYRNIPQKLLKAFRWVSDHHSFRYLLKVDDDSFADIPRILHGLDQLERHTSPVWWGRFRHNWAVEYYGKWAERTFHSMVYPPFACGGGYVVNNDVVRWLAENSHLLQLYQGEDTSMGIWLSAVGPKFVDDPLWRCDNDCISDMYAMPDTTPSELHQLWANLASCGDPCGCEDVYAS